MYLCYIDESGIPEIPGNTSHYILAGLAIPIEKWRLCEKSVNDIKQRYSLLNIEIHTGWLLRYYKEQQNIIDFEKLDFSRRRYEVEKFRKTKLFQLQKGKNSKLYHNTKKSYTQTQGYIHLSLQDRKNFVKDIAVLISKWTFSRLFAECIDKVFFDPNKAILTTDEQAFEQVVSRFEQFLKITEAPTEKGNKKNYGLLIHDNNQTVAKRHTELMKSFHEKGTLWTQIDNIIETPLFVDSALTSMIQLADICAYALRRYLENGEEELFNLIFKRADRKDRNVVGVRHFTKPGCQCMICQMHSH